MRNKQSGFGVVELIVVVIIITLLGGLGYVGYQDLIAKDGAPSQSEEFGYNLNGKPFPPAISSVEYIPAGMSSQEAVEYLSKYTKVPGLLDALKKIAEHNPCSITEGVFHQMVLGVTADQTQALIGNSCGSSGVLRSFMVEQNGQWIRVGARDGRFNDKKQDNSGFNKIFDTPSCTIVDKYHIQKALAPVCFKKHSGENNLFAGDSGNYQYILR